MSYSALMAESKRQTAAQELKVQAALDAQRKKAEQQRRAREEQDKRDRDEEMRRRKAFLEQQKREAERETKRKKEDELATKERERRALEMRDKLLGIGSKHKGGQQRPRKDKQDADDMDDDGLGSGNGHRRRGSPAESTLTREELREKKRLATLKEWEKDDRPSPRSKRGGQSGGRGAKATNTLRGGAVPIITTSPIISLDSSSGKSAKERLAAMPLTLTKLNTVKRDLRTIEEILADRDKAKDGTKKVLEGDEARNFSDWFTPKKKPSPMPSRPSSVGPSSSQNAGGGTNSTPPSARASPVPRSNPTASQSTTTTSSSGSGNKSTAPGSSAMLQKIPKSKPSPLFTNKTSKTPAPAPSNNKPRPHGESKLKRSRSPASDYSEETDSDDLDRRPAKRPAPSAAGLGLRGIGERKSYLPDDVYEMLTGGRSRNHFDLPPARGGGVGGRGGYGSDEYDSDDMEVGVDELAREEMRSARIAKKEDADALEALRRHDEEKARKKKMKAAATGGERR